MTTYGLDESHYQNGLAIIGDHLIQQGYHFFIPKASEGAHYIDPTFKTKWSQIRRAGALGAAYHFITKTPAADPADNCELAIGHDRSVRIMVDLEAYGATLADANAFRAEMNRRGYHVPLLYLPHWYWQQIGSPNLAGWTLVSSAYPSSQHAYGSALYPGDTGSGWAAYGGVTPTLWQFASTGEVDGYSGNVDLDAFRGTLNQLRALNLFTDFTRRPAPAPAPRPAPKPSRPSVNVRAGRRIRRAAKGAGPRVAALLRRIANRRIKKG